MKLKILFTIFLSVNICCQLFSQDTTEFNTKMMQATYKIEGYKSDGTPAGGTCFLVTKPNSDKVILVTAKHILDSIHGDSATVFLRKYMDGEYIKKPYKFAIRKNGINIYVSHPFVDVSAMYMNLNISNSLYMYNLPVFSSKGGVSEMDLCPGDEVRVLGYPLGLESNDAGFAILRSGRVASYPLAKDTTFLVDFEIFPGNSGGPVYLFERVGSSSLRAGFFTKSFLGLVSTEMAYHKSIKLKIAQIVRAKYVLETINMLTPN